MCAIVLKSDIALASQEGGMNSGMKKLRVTLIYSDNGPSDDVMYKGLLTKPCNNRGPDHVATSKWKTHLCSAGFNATSP